MILVSIVIPVYNKEEYLEDCLASVVNQSYEELEIIVINDGSTDASESIIKKWESKDNRIKYLCQKNHGVAITRNNGIRFSKGEYIYFVDADDYLNLNAIEILYKHSIQTPSDIISGNNSAVRNNQIQKNRSLNKRILYPVDLKNTRIKAEMFLVQNRSLASACNKLYKTSFLKGNNLKFTNNVLAEDRLFNLMCYLHNPVIILANDYTYYYNVIDNSRSRGFSKNFFASCISLIHELDNYLKKNEIAEENKDLLQITALNEMIKIISYYYTYYPNIKALNESIDLMKSDILLHYTLKQVSKEKTLNKITVSKNDYIRFNVLLKLLLHAPKPITATFYILFKKLASLKKLVKES